MAVIFKCKMCGGDLNIEEGALICECEYCGTSQTVPALDNEKKINLFTRANRLRFNNEFDAAAGVFQSIVSEFPDEAEAYWGLCLCKFGIEYVDDPATAKKIPTCHRTSFDSIFDDENFEQACENADAIARRLYRDEAKEIDRLQKAILNIAKNEAPYDIFICYKETAPSGERTLDSVRAQDMYDALTEKGYKVFFARITLEDKLGQEYEPYIFSALSTAKIMLAVGTDYEYFNATWVKNEWGRFLDMMKRDKSKVLIPCYEGIDAYDMPKEFKNLQAQDMGKVGFMQDLIRGIGKILRPVEAPAPMQQTIINQAAGTNVENLLKRGFMALEEGKWDEAGGFFNRVLDENAEEARAYLGLLMCDCRANRVENLADCAQPFDNNANYQKAERFGDAGLVNQLEQFIKTIRERNEENRRRAIYDQAVNILTGPIALEDEYLKAKSIFESLRGYRDSDALLAKYNECFGVAHRIQELRETIKQYSEELIQYEITINQIDRSVSDEEEKIQNIREEKGSLVMGIIWITVVVTIATLSVVAPMIFTPDAYTGASIGGVIGALLGFGLWGIPGIVMCVNDFKRRRENKKKIAAIRNIIYNYSKDLEANTEDRNATAASLERDKSELASLEAALSQILDRAKAL